MKNSRDLILDKVVYKLYQSSIISKILDFIHWMFMTFSFDHMAGENHELITWIMASALTLRRMCLTHSVYRSFSLSQNKEK